VPRGGGSARERRNSCRALASAEPRDSLVGDLPGDLLVELAFGVAELRLPAGEGVGALLDAIDAVHELEEVLGSCPLVVGSTDQDVERDR
jgi:hypothetical protein